MSVLEFVETNFCKVKFIMILPAIIILLIILLLLLNQGKLSVETYIEIQKNLFFYINKQLSQFQNIQFNITQLGNPLILFSLLTIFIIYVPQLWAAILTSTIISALLTFVLKELFDVPRPAAIFNQDSFMIIGKIHTGYASLPSGHSVTAFTAITLILFGFMPKAFMSKIAFITFILINGIFISFSRVGVGAHFPLDTIIGCSLGYMVALISIILINKVNIGIWADYKKYHTIIMLLLALWSCAIINEILINNLLILYFSLFSIIITLYLMIKIHVKK